jgi:hypothetical protein
MQRSSAAAVAGSARRGDESQRDQHADEPLLRAVVQIAFDPPARVVGGCDDPGARLLQLEACVDVGHGVRDQFGERAQARLRLRRPGLGARGRRERAP